MAAAHALRTALPWLGALSLLALAGCPNADDAPAGGTDPGTSSGTDGGSSSGTATGADDTAGAEQDVPARGVTIRRVDANSGAAITLFSEGTVVAPADRGPLPKNRDTAVRVYVDVDDDIWVQRELMARLTMVLPDGTIVVQEQRTTIAADSSDTSLQSNFLLGATADTIVPGAEYRIELFEAGEDYETLPEPSTPPAVPAQGTAPLGAQQSTQRIRVVLVPVDYTSPDVAEVACQAEIDTSAENLQRYIDPLFQQNPVEEVELLVHDPMVVDDLDLGQPGGVFQLLGRTAMLRADDAPDPDQYYYALFDNCTQCVGADLGGGGGCTLGVAAGISQETQGAAGTRVAVGVNRSPSSPDGGPETFVHELGHNQGRNHIACPGQVAEGPDRTYPYEGGSIGVWGFGVIDFTVRNPSNYNDYMSYCSPSWVSDWQWSATFDRIQELSSWGFGGDSGDAPAKDEGRLLVGAVNPTTGEQQWWTDTGTLNERDYSAGGWPLKYALAQDATVTRRAAVSPWSEGPWVTVRAPLGDDVAARVHTIALTAPGRTFTRAATAIHRLRGLGSP